LVVRNESKNIVTNVWIKVIDTAFSRSLTDVMYFTIRQMDTRPFSWETSNVWRILYMN